MAYTAMTHMSTQRRKWHLASLLLAALLAMGGFQAANGLPASLEAQRAMTEAPSTLVLNITGYAPQTGKIMIALFADEASFDAEANPLREAQLSADRKMTMVTFEDLPVGEYAFKLYHDANDNGELDTNGFGIPSEDYYFSTDASDPFSAPEWGESKFVLPSGRMTRDIDLD